METNRPVKVFLCHAHSDAVAVRALYNRLVKDGVDVWLDKEKILPGQDWELEIRKAVRESDVVVVCHSKQFNQKGFRQKEVRIALEEADLLPKGEIFIIPARLEECDVLEDLQRWHWVDLFESNGYDNLMRALQARATKVGATLQIHKGWLPSITSPRPKIEKPVALNKDSSEEAANKEKTGRESAKEAAQEKTQRELEREAERVVKESKRRAQRIKWQYRWETFIGEVHYRLKLLRINLIPIMIILIGLAVIIPLLIELSKKIPELTQALNSTPQPSQIPTAAFVPSKAFTPISTFTTLPPSEAPQPSLTPIAGIYLTTVRDMNANSSPIVSLSFPSDTKTLLVGSEDGAVRVWQIDNGNLLSTITGNYAYAQNAKYAFSPDGKTVASGSWNDFSVKIVQISDGRVIQSVASKNNGPATSMAMSHGGKTLAVSYWVDNVIRLWQIDNGKLLWTRDGLGDIISFSNDGTIIGILDRNELDIRNASNSSLIYSVVDKVNCFAFSPDNSVLALELSNGDISFRQLADGKQLSVINGQPNNAKNLVFSPDGTLLALSFDNTVQIWNVADKKLMSTVSESLKEITTLAFSSDGQFLASGSDNGIIELLGVVR